MQSFVLMIKKDPSIVALLLANLVPLLGFLFFEWSLLSLFFVYWIETVIIGLYNILKILVSGIYTAVSEQQKSLKPYLLPFIYVLFFCFHFFGVLGGVLLGIFSSVEIPQDMIESTFLRELENVSKIAVLGFVLSHGVSFCLNFIGKKEYQRKPFELHLFLPYIRIFVMMLAIFFGGLLTLGNYIPSVYMAFFVLCKIYFDVHSHTKERRSQKNRQYAS
jgi:hypothetical protein